MPATAAIRHARRKAGGLRARASTVSQGSGVGLDWKWVDSVRAVTKVPFLTKGILTGEDAAACVEHGVNGIVVSNHGGRAMDYGPATLEVLAEVVDGTKGRIPVLVDGGFRRGTDVLKALALGAKAVCLGRVPRWGLAAYGAAGSQRILEIVQAELRDGNGGDRTSHAGINRPDSGEDGFLMGAKYTRRTALAALGAWQAASPLLNAQETRWPRSAGEPPGRIAPLDELLNTFEIEAMAERKLSSTAFSAIAGGDRNAFDHLIFRPRRYINAEEVDLTSTLFGDAMYTPILVGPASEQCSDFIRKGELAYGARRFGGEDIGGNQRSLQPANRENRRRS